MYTCIHFEWEGKMALIDTLRDQILSGALRPGVELLQTDLAARFGVSRIPVRDALQGLAAERLVRVIPNKGAQVIVLTRDELSEVYDLRLLLETDLIHRAARQAGPGDHAEALHQLRKSDLEAVRPGWATGDAAFHAALYAPARRPRQMAMVTELRRCCALHSAQYDSLIANTDQWLEDHQSIHDTWAKGQADVAAALLAQHIEAARDLLLAQMA